jgi:hypothetical protein
MENKMTFEEYLDLPYIVRICHKMYWYRARICPSCKFPESHSLRTCGKCGHQTMLFKEYKGDYTIRDWMNQVDQYKEARRDILKEDWQRYLDKPDTCKYRHKYRGLHTPTCNNCNPCKACLKKWVETFYSKEEENDNSKS